MICDSCNDIATNFGAKENVQSDVMRDYGNEYPVHVCDGSDAVPDYFSDCECIGDHYTEDQYYGTVPDNR